MAGHNKWSKVKHIKAKTDAVKGKAFSKMAREIMVAAKQGGADPDMNATLRLAIQKAKQVNMPRDNIERAIQKGAGGGQEANLDQLLYEAYAPGGVALVIECLTDNKNRTASNIRAILSKAGASLAAEGSVTYLFQKKGFIYVVCDKQEEALLDLVLGLGALDIEQKDTLLCVECQPEDFVDFVQKIESASFVIESSSIEKVAENTVVLEGEKAQKCLNLIENLEEDDDVQEVYGNYDIMDEGVE